MRVRFSIQAGVFNGVVRWYVWDEQAKARITEPTPNRTQAEASLDRFERDVSGESLQRVGE